jgi:hypothetical protein
MKEKLIDFIKNHLFRTVGITFLLLIILPPLLINAMYKVPAFWWVFENEIPAGNLISYWGTVLTFCATFSLSIIVYLQNKENIKNTKLINNEALITINSGSFTNITILDAASDSPSMIIDFKVKVLSKATIAAIYLRYFSFEYNGSVGERESHTIVSSPEWELIKFQRNVEDTSFSLALLKISNELKAFLDSKDNFTARMDVEILCNDVITPVTIILALKKHETFKTLYTNGRIHIIHGKPEIKKK